ncbi:NUDIX domain-containing protein [Methyloceanibacter sp. wino2]|uniref:NUDIX hydrolase n=1 Tax=Methyloceanibacter sp. wino2 TaxID=2170729 RepID=UPI001ABBC7EC|nr:NUDIX domain-containing protein [Methyloceanibacter sp. wino2]
MPARVDAWGREALYTPMAVIDLSAVILYDDQDRILLQHRTDDAPTFPGYWSFFGGGVEPGETLEEAAVREAYEELSYTLKAPSHWLSQRFSNAGRAYAQHIFLEPYDGAELILGEGQAMKWFAPNETGVLLMSAHASAAVEALDRWLAWASVDVTGEGD